MKTNSVVVALVYSDVTERQLVDLLSSRDVWLVESAQNLQVSSSVWAQRDVYRFPGSLTTFARDQAAPSDELFAATDLVDAHYSPFSVNGSWRTIEIYGLDCDIGELEAIKSEYTCEIHRQDERYVFTRIS